MTRPHGDPARYRRGPSRDGRPGGCRCGPCTKANSRYKNQRILLITSGRWEPFTDATGTRRRLQALARRGWSLGKLSARLGTSRRAIEILRYQRVTPAVAAKVAALYDELWDQPPPMATWAERSAASQAGNYARRQGWVPPLGWDDEPGPHCIDDPAAVPVPGWEPRAEQPPTGSPLLAAKIRQAREAAGMTRPRLGSIIGVTASAIKQWEDGNRTPSEDRWIQLELTLGPLGVVRDRSAGDGDGGQRQGSEVAA